MIAERSHQMSEAQIVRFLEHEKKNGASETLLRQRSRFVNALYSWLPDEKCLTKETLQLWRQELYAKGYSSVTVGNYIKGINRYLDFVGCSGLRFRQGQRKDLTGKQFGYLTALRPSEERNRRDIVWICRCRCGNEVHLPATRLLTGSNMSCGCLKAEYLQKANLYFDSTSIRASLAEQVESTRASSGFTGVTAKRGKWLAHITYKGKRYSLGSYTNLEDAVKARARAKELVQEDARKLLVEYEKFHQTGSSLPSRDEIPQVTLDILPQTGSQQRSPNKRSDNTSGTTGVTRNRGMWIAKITFQKKTYHLGCYADLEQAVQARKTAEHLLKEDPARFPERIAKVINRNSEET